MAADASQERRQRRRMAELPPDWPNREFSHFLNLDGIRWHYQRLGQGPKLLLIHGTAASTHSWRKLASILSKDFEVLMPDLPGQGFTLRQSHFRPSLDNMANALFRFTEHLEYQPRLTVGHSAGAAIAIEMVLKQGFKTEGLVSVNGALLPFHGSAGRLFPALAKMLFLNPFVPRLYAWSAGDRRRVKRLLEASGSKVDEERLDLYIRLLSEHRHVSAALAMMAHWNLEGLRASLKKLDTPLLLIVGDNDKAIAPEQADTVAASAKAARVAHLPGLGHLAHEEAPEAVAGLIAGFAQELAEGTGQGSCRASANETSVT